MNFEEFKNQLILSANNGTLLIPKHDPYNLDTMFSSYRTVLSHNLADNLSSFISSGNYSVVEYENLGYPNSPYYFEITPNKDSGFNIPASGVTAYSIIPSTAVDKIIAVSGVTKGMHLFGEDSSVIRAKIRNNNLKKIKKLK